MDSLVVKFDDSEWRKKLAGIQGVLNVKGPQIVFKAGHKFRNEVMTTIESGRRGKHKGAIGSTGDLRKRIHVEQGSRGSIITAVVRPGVRYAVFVHEGTRPHFPPLAPLEVWVRRKLRVKGTEVTRVAKSIQYKIGRHGTTAFPFFRITEKRYGKTIQKMIARDIRGIIHG